MIHRLSLILALVAAVALSAACAAGNTAQGGASGKGTTVRIGTFNFSESRILGELYGQALENAGFSVERRFNLGNREVVAPALESGQIDFVPEYLATYLTFITRTTDPITNAQQGKTRLDEAVRPKNLTALNVAQAINTNAFVVTRATADRYGLRTMSDLGKDNVRGQLVLGGPPECPQRPFCQPGVEQTYNARFREFRPLDAGGPLTVQALRAGQVDIGLLFSTDAAIAANDFVLLQDDKSLQSADNIVPIVRNQVVNEALRNAVNGVTGQLTSAELTDLNKQVDVDRREPREVATAWLRSKNLLR
jgi:osmoprotectant transport system substrate-binding protein